MNCLSVFLNLRSRSMLLFCHESYAPSKSNRHITAYSPIVSGYSRYERDTVIAESVPLHFVKPCCSLSRGWVRRFVSSILHKNSFSAIFKIVFINDIGLNFFGSSQQILFGFGKKITLMTLQQSGIPPSR